MRSPSPSGIRLLIVDDHALFREGLAVLLNRTDDIKVVGRCGSTAEALSFIETAQPSVVILDFDLGTERAFDFLEAARERGFNCRVLIVTAGVSEQEAVQLVQAGVAGIVHKHNTLEMLCDTIRRIAAGEVWLEKNYLKPLFRTLDQSRTANGAKLTERDRTVLRLIFQGLANKEIAARLNLSEGAVKASLRQLFQKLGVRTRAQVVKVALEEYRDQLSEQS
jgi:two-component system nitrate/nitrite response regulator NarL